MFTHVLEQVAILGIAAVLLGIPGAALVSLLRVRAVLPDSLAVPAAALLGSFVACVATAVQLALSVEAWVAMTTHAALSVLLAGGALFVHRRRRAAGTPVVPAARGWSRTTTAVAIVAGLFAWVIRGSVALDGLYHIALSRKLLELAEPTFSNVNRFADGGPNPVYALPGWHAFIGWSGALAGSDPIIAWEIMPVLVVVLGTLAAGGLARVLLATPRAEAVGALGWLLARVLFARREVDGDAILYGAVPGQVTFELALPVALAAIAVAMSTRERGTRRAAIVTIFVGILAIVVYHANYLPYVAIIGLGYSAWWLAARHNRGHDGRSLLVVGGAVAAMSAACFAVLLPLLAQLENFGNADETNQRIDYHLGKVAGVTIIRGGHVFEMLGVVGMLAILAVPVLAWRYRAKAPMAGVAWGGLLALLTFCFVPPLFESLRATGSLTLLLRINHPIGTLLVVAFAALVLELADWVLARGWSHRRRQVAGVIVIFLMACVGVVLGYDRFMTDWPGYLAWVALVVVFVAVVVQSRRDSIRDRRPNVDELGSSEHAATNSIRNSRSEVDASGSSGEPRLACRGLVASTAVVLTLGLLLPVGAISVRRALENADDFVAANDGLAQGDLRCIGGSVFTALQNVPAGSVVLSDPVASFRAMAVAPVYVVGDYKVWNTATSDNRAEERLANINRFFDASQSDGERMAAVQDQHVDYLLMDVGDGRWLDEPTSKTRSLEAAWASLDSFADVQAYDGGGVARLLRRNEEAFTQLAVDDRADEAAIPEATPDEDAPCNSYGLWSVNDESMRLVHGEFDHPPSKDLVPARSSSGTGAG
ncbi:MAG: hypothetical protein JWL76_1618 [Thermoleophilia bacterium]|nr:hypothetical protein [Thermoleophilia bacterium]